MIRPRRFKARLDRAADDVRETRDLTRQLVRRTRLLQKRARSEGAKQNRLLRRQRRANQRLAALSGQLDALRREMAAEHAATRRELVGVRNYLALQHEVVAVNEAAFGPHRDALSGRDVVVVASGPTVNHYEPVPGAVHVGVNSLISQTRIPLDFYFAHDFGPGQNLPQVVAQFDEGKVPADCQVFFGLKVSVPYGHIEASHSLTARVGATRYFVSPSPTPTLYPDIRFHPLADFYTITFAALHFALFTNPRRIRLVGCDVSYFGHFDGSPQPESDEQIRTYLTHRLVGYRRMRDFARPVYPGTEIVSVNPVNLAGLFTDELTPGADYRRSPHQAALADADFSDEAIAVFVEEHIAEVKQRHDG